MKTNPKAKTQSPKRPISLTARKTRERLLSHFAAIIGGYGAHAGTHSGRLKKEMVYENDKEVARYLLGEFKRDIERKVRKEKA